MIISLASVTISLTIGLITIGYGETSFDFVLKVNNASTNNDNDKLTLFAINGESYKGAICPSGQCYLEGEIDPSFSAPNPDTQYMSFDADFILRDNMPNPNVGLNEKTYLERFNVSNYGCRVDDIMEDSGQETYTCHGGTTTVTRTFDSKSWKYETNLVYDAKNNTLTVYGNYAGS